MMLEVNPLTIINHNIYIMSLIINRLTFQFYAHSV